MERKITQEFADLSVRLINVLSSFTAGQFNKIPFEGSWTPAQVADHILKFCRGISGLFNGRTEKTDRPIDEKVEATGKVFLDMSIKMQSPDFIKPDNIPHDKSEMIHKVQATMETLISASRESELSEICLDFELPGFGPFTKLEWLYFLLFHTTRHTRQLENIKYRLL